MHIDTLLENYIIPFCAEAMVRDRDDRHFIPTKLRDVSWKTKTGRIIYCTLNQLSLKPPHAIMGHINTTDTVVKHCKMHQRQGYVYIQHTQYTAMPDGAHYRLAAQVMMASNIFYKDKVLERLIDHTDTLCTPIPENEVANLRVLNSYSEETTDSQSEYLKRAHEQRLLRVEAYHQSCDSQDIGYHTLFTGKIILHGFLYNYNKVCQPTHVPQ